MSQITATFVVEPYDITIQTPTSNVQIEPTVLDLNIYTGSFAGAGGNTQEVQFNNGGILGGIPVAVYTNNNIVFNSINNFKLAGGANAYYLQTDGTGNVTWAPGTVNANTGNGIPVGANGQIQLTDGTGNFVSAPGFTFDNVSNVLTVPGNIQSVNANLGNATVSNYFIGDGSLLTNISAANFSNGTSNIIIYSNANITFSVAGIPNIAKITSTSIYTDYNLQVTGNANIANLNVNTLANLSSVANVKISGGSNGQFIQTDGNGNLQFANAVTIDWSNVANISIGDILLGKQTSIGAITPISPGDNLICGNLISSNFQLNNANLANGMTRVNQINTFWMGRTFSGNFITNSFDGTNWTTKATPLAPARAPVKGQNNIVIYATGTNLAAYSSTFGNSWTNVTLPTSQSWGPAAYGSSSFVILANSTATPNCLRSTNDGVTWSNVSIGNLVYYDLKYGNNTFIAVAQGNIAKRSTDDGATWSNISMPDGANIFVNSWTGIAYGNNRWVAVSDSSVGSLPSRSAVSLDDGNTWTTANLGNTEASGVIYTGEYFIMSTVTGNVVKYSTDGLSWTDKTCNITGRSIAYNSSLQQVIVSDAISSSNYQFLEASSIRVTSSDGNIANGQSVPLGTYKNLGGIVGNNGALWQRVA